MSENTAIQWTDHTFNPWIGCTKVSPGCDNCYAEMMLAKRFQKVGWGHGEPRLRTKPASWDAVLTWDRKARAAGERRRVFCASAADVFDAEVPQEWRESLWDLIAATTNLDWQLLTKRPNLINSHTRADILANPACWWGTSVESQQYADLRIPHLLSARVAGLRFLSCEPLLGELELFGSEDGDWRNGEAGVATGPAVIRRRVLLKRDDENGPEEWDTVFEPGIDWVIVGGESGSKARPCHGEWGDTLRRQCAAAGVAFFFKQWGSRPFYRGEPLKLRDRHGGEPSEWPEGMDVRQFPEAAR
jgi:protein gp37